MSHSNGNQYNSARCGLLIDVLDSLEGSWTNTCPKNTNSVFGAWGSKVQSSYNLYTLRDVEIFATGNGQDDGKVNGGVLLPLHIGQNQKASRPTGAKT